jgi:citrate lyase subunit beta/citryl-CoA lyase
MHLVSPWRSLLFLPAHNDKFIKKAHTRGADAYILDLEDSVPFELKEQARQEVKEAASLVSKGCADVLVRVNYPLRLAIRDLEAVIDQSISAIVLPKVTSAAQVCLLAEVINELEVERNITVGHTGIIAQIEDVNALPYIDEIATSSPRLLGMTIGSEDFSASAGMEPIPEALFAPNQQVLMACRRANIMPLGFPASIADFSDTDEFSKTIAFARQLGFIGAFCIHPAQVAILNQFFVPSAEEIEHAQGLVEAFKEQSKLGKAAIEYRGKMIDPPVVLRAENLLKRARR